MTSASSTRDRALETLSAGHLHQSLWLPQTTEHPRLRVTYATTSNFDDVSLPAILFIGPLFNSRYLVLEIDKLARDCGVRVIIPERYVLASSEVFHPNKVLTKRSRPSTGGSTPVSLNIRMKVWLETVPALLRKTNVQHVSLVTHSAGGTYTLNTLAELRSILDPKAPFVGLLAPWVPTADSKAPLTSLASKLPANVINYLSPLQGFMVSKVAPTLSFSGGLVSSTAALVGGGAKVIDGPTQTGSPEDAAEKYGVDIETAKIMRSLVVKFNLAEDTTGANEEAKLCLMKGGKADWGALADYEACVQSIADREKERVQAGEVKLRMEAAFATSDVIIGKGGQEYFERCWRREGVAGSVDFASRTCEGVDHDGVLVDFHKGALKGFFESVANRPVL